VLEVHGIFVKSSKLSLRINLITKFVMVIRIFGKIQYAVAE